MGASTRDQKFQKERKEKKWLKGNYQRNNARNEGPTFLYGKLPLQ